MSERADLQPEPLHNRYAIFLAIVVPCHRLFTRRSRLIVSRELTDVEPLPTMGPLGVAVTGGTACGSDMA
jgi:hypothetical protein